MLFPPPHQIFAPQKFGAPSPVEGQLDQRVEVRLAHINSRSLMALRLSQGRQTTDKVAVAGSPDAGNTL